ncbi:MAG TPA: 16S rRNA (cytosine(1402)-N(4))-methyltransferase RsmH [Candidatus Moranbacteria bacterium]|nr:16S rRNA (cytosine(1402)-N(4))-methyltransferase RsmH [Candidatus Moranbacteria bacterium]
MSLHKPVLLKETVELLNIKEGSIVVDATLGGGGHSREILRKIGEKGTLVSIDADAEAIKNFTEFPISNFQFPNNFQIPIFKFQNVYLVNDNFSNLGAILEAASIRKVDAILADLGWSSDQLEGRGMSFLKDEPLDMRFDSNQKLAAREVVNEYSQEDLERILKEYGEERFAKNISRKIVEYRKDKIIETTGELAEIIKSAVPEKYKHGKINSATRTFQAIRVEVNGELDNLEKFIPKSIEALISGGRLAIISFHSLEDRIVKNIFRENAGGCICPKNFPQCICGKIPKVKIITKKPIVPEEKELENNPRARSARLRICEKI